MTNYILKAEPGHINLSPVGFRLLAQDFFKCYLDFKEPRRFSFVPYFLCCRSIELGLKAIHLETYPQAFVKSKYCHDLVKLYKDLPKEKQILLEDELELLSQINEIYKKKDFEYLNVHDAATGFERFPDIVDLAQIVKKIIAFDD